MASRLGKQAPDPRIRHNVRRARARQQTAHDLRGLIIAASLAATVGSTAFFAHQDAQAQAAATAGQTAATAAATPASTGSGLDIAGFLGLNAGSAVQSATAAAPAVASNSQGTGLLGGLFGSGNNSGVSSLTRTRSSR